MFSSFVVKFGDEYCRFASYSECTLVNSPLKATLYARKSDAEKRASEEHWIKRTCYKASNFRVVEITAEVTEKN